jgi:hypothetical protein
MCVCMPQQGEEILRVPFHRELRITSALMRETSEFYAAVAQHPTAKNMDEHLRAGLWILEQKRRTDSPWAIWIGMCAQVSVVDEYR